MKGAVLFEGVWLAPNSVAYELYQKQEWGKLRVHMRELDLKQQKLEGVITPSREKQHG